MKMSILLKELGFNNTYTVYEYIETEKLIYVIVGKSNSNQFCNFTTGEYAKWKSKGDWFTPNYINDGNVYDEIQNKKNMVTSLK